jgi:hypothetical protein
MECLPQAWSVPVLMSQPLPFVNTFVEAIDEAIRAHHPLSPSLSTIQRRWLGLCLMGVLVTNSVCWARFERASLGRYSLAALSWMFRHAKLPWALLLQKSVQVVLSQHGMTGGSLVVDDADKARSKSTHRLAYVHKLKDKTSGGFLMGQTLVFLLLVTERITVPVGFAFYVPDPVLSAWRQQDRALKKQGVLKCQRPAKPPRNEAYPTKPALALQLLAQFRHHHPALTLKAVLADALYGTAYFVDAASAIFGGVQVISQLRRNQSVRYRQRTLSVQQYFERYPGVPHTLRIRGGRDVHAQVGSARLYVGAHGKKRFVIALKYAGEEDYRYRLASERTGRTQDIIHAFTLRWRVEIDQPCNLHKSQAMIEERTWADATSLVVPAGPAAAPARWHRLARAKRGVNRRCPAARSTDLGAATGTGFATPSPVLEQAPGVSTRRLAA